MRRHPLRSTSARLMKPSVERVEARVLLATFTVTNTTDTTSMGSLRWAIGQSNASPGSNLINFDIASSGVQTIDITSALPAITVPVTIDGTTEPGYTTTPVIELDGSGAGSGVDGLDISAGASTVKGLAINRFTGEGISLSVAGDNLITKDFLGTNPAGTVAEGNGLDGLLVQVNSDNNTISGNLMSGNTDDGIYLNGQLFGATNPVTSGNLITGNLLGTDVTGTVTLGNDEDGIAVQNAPMTTIGGTTAATRNIISGNGAGMELFDNSDDSVIEGNYVGTDITGSVALGNNGPNGFFKDNIVFRGISNSTVGGTATGAGNVISGGSNYGIDCFVIGSENLAIEGNLIGTDATGTKALGNKTAGINIWSPTGVTIGGTVAGARNIISGNAGDGITTFANGAGLLIEGNFIGTDITGTKPLGNGGDGINATFAGITIGGPLAGDGNIIANNGATAVFDHDGVNVTATDTPVLSNSIYNNKNLGIDIGSTTSTQPAPVLTSAVSMNLDSTVTGTLTAPAGVYSLQFFSTPSLNTSGNAEGETLIGTGTVTVMGASANFNLTLPSGFVPGTYITATATNSSGGTSQFSVGIVGTGTGSLFVPPTISVKASNASVPADSDVTDTFTITNPNGGPAQGVIFSDAIPVGTTFVSGMTSSGAQVVVTGGVATASIGTLGADQSVTVTIVLGTSIATIPSFTNLAEVVSLIPQAFAGTETASATTAVTGAADLAVMVDGPSSSTSVGQNLTYVVTVTNNGPSISTGGVLTDTLPANATFISSTPSSGSTETPVNGILIYDYGDLGIGATFTLTIVVNAGVGSVPTATDTATVMGDEPDPNTNNNTASFAANITPLADVLVSIVPSAASVVVGGSLTYTVTVTNSGPSPATGVLLNDTLPTGVTYVSATSNAGLVLIEADGVVSGSVDMLAAGASFEVTITVMATAAAASMIQDTANVSANESDPNQMNNNASVTTDVLPVADIAIVSQTVSPNPVIEGNVVLITIEVVNNGPSTATGVSVTDLLPAGLTFVSGSASGGNVTASGGVVTAPVGTLIDGADTMILIAAITSTVGSLTVSSTVSADVSDPDQANNSASTSFDIVAMADLSIDLSGPAGPVYTGDTLMYTAVVTNNGPSPATNAMFVDPLFAGASFVGVEANGVGGSLDNGVVEQPLGTIAAGASVTVVLLVVPTLSGDLTNTAYSTSDTTDPNLTNNSSSVTTTLVTPMSLITFSSPTYDVGNNAGYASITLVRSGYEEDDVTVHFSTVGGNAVPGVDYEPISTTVDFPAGSTQETVLVPVLNDAYENHNNLVNLQLDTPTGSAILDPNPTTATLTIIDTDPDLVGPTITALKLIGYVSSITAVEVDTTGHLNPSTATDTANYTFTALGGGGKTGLRFGTVVPVSLATYNATTGAISLTPATPLPGNEVFEININGSRTGAVSDVAGNPLNSVVGVTPGSDYNLDVARGTDLTYIDENNDPVVLKLSGPGTVDLDQYVNGYVEFLQVVGGVANKTVVTGTVHPTSKRTTIGSILGLGQFGSIRLKMTTPPFYVTNKVYPNLQTQVGPPAIDTLLPAPPAPAKPVKTKEVKAKSEVKAKAIESTSHHPKAATVHASTVHAAESRKSTARHHR